MASIIRLLDGRGEIFRIPLRSGRVGEAALIRFGPPGRVRIPVAFQFDAATYFGEDYDARSDLHHRVPTASLPRGSKCRYRFVLS